jgi:LacI family transcriptional regulator
MIKDTNGRFEHWLSEALPNRTRHLGEALSMTRRPRVALIVETSSVYGRRILCGIRRYVRAHRPWSIFLEQRAFTTKPPGWLNAWDGDGIISRTSTTEMIKAAARTRVPLVELTDRHGDFGLPRVWSDNTAVSQLAADHLLERGFRHFAFCGFSREYWSKQRLASFVEIVGARGFDCGVYESPWFGLDVHPWEEEQQQLANWLKSLPKPVGVMACNDVRGHHVLGACNRIGAAVPEEIAVIGVDNEEELCELCDPPLTSVIPNPEMVGFKAAELLDQMMSGQRPTDLQQLVAPLGVATRQSTDVLAIDDPHVAAAVRYIREHACEGATVDDVLEHVPVTRSVLERRFRKHLDRSPQVMIRQTQLKRVRQLLAETDLPLIKISELAGFKHQEHLCVVFKREYGDSPGAYRRKTQG